MFNNKQSWVFAGAALLLASACGGVEDTGPVGEKKEGGGKADDLNDSADPAARAVCVQDAAHPSTVLADALADSPGAIENGAPVIGNYTAWPVYNPFTDTPEMPSEITRRIEDTDEARKNIASRYGGCESDVLEHIETDKPNVYVYFTGFGGAAQNNSLIGQGAVLRWINDRDPNALIFSINWNCAAEDNEYCARNTAALQATDDDPHVASMNRAIDVIVPQIADPALADQLKGAIAGFGQQQQGYDSALSHSTWLAARLIDQLLVAEVGDIHVLGYSMGAHSAADLLVQDFTEDGSGGYKWSRKACEDGSAQCTVAELENVKWSLAMGLSGWSHALRAENGLDSGSPTPLADREQFQNGGLFRVGHPAYQRKLAVLNRRMDPTGNSDDTFQRGFLDIFFGDYNHYSHDYDLPLFVEVDFIRMLDAFLENRSSEGVAELGIVTDHASKVDFDECEVGTSCEAWTDYVAHLENRSHAVLDVPKVDVETTDGVVHPDNANNVAAKMTDGASPIALRTFDQEDLRGAVELYLRPHYDVSGGGLHGVFSYGSCEGSDEDLMPQAFVEDGELVMQMTYQGERFEVRTDAAAAGLREDEWTHLSFNWELPVESLTVQHDDAQELGAQLPGMIGDLQKHQVALVLATGLTKPLATTYKRQKGEGSMTIFANGEAVASAALGNADSARDCLSAAQVLSTEGYDVNGEQFPPFNPYARYDAQTGDIVAFSANEVLGTKCKAHRVRNEEAFFGCAQSDRVNAEADMDDIMLVWGPGRTEFENIDHGTGQPKLWPIGVEYGPERFEVGKSGGGDDGGGSSSGQTLTIAGGEAIPDANDTGLVTRLTAEAGDPISNVSISLKITHTFRSDLSIALEHNGEVAVLFDRSGGGQDDLALEGSLDVFNGMDPAGDWTLHVLDLAPVDTGTLDSFELTIE